MEINWYLVGIIVIIYFMFKINDKIAHNKKMKKMDEEIKKRNRYYRHPVSTISEHDAKKFKKKL